MAKRHQKQAIDINSPGFWLFIGAFLLFEILNSGVILSFIFSTGVLFLYSMIKGMDNKTNAPPKSQNIVTTKPIYKVISKPSDKPDLSKNNAVTSIIDITGKSENIVHRSKPEINENDVPYWAHRYIYSYSDINNESDEIKQFYKVFRDCFLLKRKYLDLKGNSNYAFILMFDLLNQYEKHKDIVWVEKQLQRLGNYYSLTKRYCTSFLLKIKKQVAEDSQIIGPQTQNWNKVREIQNKQRREVNVSTRKKIELDSTAIEEAELKHSITVDLLNEFLADESEEENKINQIQRLKKEDLKINYTQKKDTETATQSIYSIKFSPVQLETMEIFKKLNLSVPYSEINAFAKSKNVFKNQLIESINETCYEKLDDVLIEEENDHYTINEVNYQLLLAK